MVSGAGSAVPTGDDEPSTFPKPSFRGLHTLARTLGNAEPASTPSSSAPAAASAYGFHFGSFPLEAFPDTFASNVIPLFRARKGGVVARARAADDGADAKKERSGEDVEDASDGDSDSDDDAYDIPDTTRGSSGDSGDPAPGRPKKATGEEDDSERGVSLKKEKERRAFFKSRPELARSVVTFSETAEMLCLLTAGGVRVAQLTQMGRERRLPFQAAAGPKRSVAFVAAAAAPAPARPPRIARQGGERRRRRARRRRRRARHAQAARRKEQRRASRERRPGAGGDDAAQFADVVSRVRARAALLADVKKDLASSRLQAEIAAKAAARAASQGAVTPTQTQTQTEPAAAAASGDASASPSLAAARLEARRRWSGGATARHREAEARRRARAAARRRWRRRRARARRRRRPC